MGLVTMPSRNGDKETDMAQQMVIALIHEENGRYGVSFPDFPGCVTAADNTDEALARGRDTLAYHVRGMSEDGDAMPVIHSLGELRKDPDFRKAAKGAVIALVPVDLPGKTVRVNISMDENLIEAIDRAAKFSGQSRSAFLADAARARILKAG